MAAMAPEPLLIAFLTFVVASAAAAAAAFDGLVDFPLSLEATKNLGASEGEISKLPPWVVVVNLCNVSQSLGARISRRWVLSEAHFTIGFRKDQFTISTDWYSKSQLQVDKVVTHNKYLLDWRYTVTLLRTKEDMTGGELINLPNSAPKSDSKLNVYGMYLSSENVMFRITTEMKVQDHSACSNLSKPKPNTDLQLCVGTVGDIMSCHFLPGGLVVLNNSVLVGIVPIYPRSCHVTALHTSVAGFRKWIKTTTSV